MIRKILLASCVSLISLGVFAQNGSLKVGAMKSTNTAGKKAQNSGVNNLPAHRTCATPVMSDAELMQFEDGMQRSIANVLAEQAANLNSDKTAAVIYTIPVVVHVIYNNGEAVGSGHNISAAQVQSQITAMNKDYTMTNTDIGSVPAAFSGVKADCQINFCLAQRTPTGAAMTEPGIDRLNRTTKGWNDPGTMSQSAFQTYVDGTIKPNSIWDPTKYLNIWVCDANTSGLLGYATFPAGVSNGSSMGFTSSLGTATTDGVVINYQGFGTTGTAAAPYNKGRTVTHEVGHWLGLFHTFQGGCAGLTNNNCGTQGDMCCDTPPTTTANYSCPGTQNTCTETSPFPSPYTSNQNDQTMNYMDYTDDACMYMFTANQKTRIHAVLNATSGGTYRKGLSGSNSCTPPGGAVAPVANFSGCNSNLAVNSTVTLTDLSTNVPTSWSWAITPATGWAYQNSTTATSQNPQVKFTAVGTYQIALTATNSAGSNTKTTAGCMVVVASSGACDTLFNAEANDTLSIFYLGTWGYYPGNNSYNLSYADKFTNTMSGTVSSFYIPIYQADQKSTAGVVTFKLYGPGATPTGTALATKTMAYSALVANQYNQITFPTPANITGDFYISMELANAATPQDTVITGLNFNRSTTAGHINNTAFIKYNGTWSAANTLLAGLKNQSMEILPVLCPLATSVNAPVNLVNNVNIFPNPSNGLVNLMLAFENYTDAAITITNVLGQVVYNNVEKNVNVRQVEIDLSTQAKGTYFISVKTSQGLTTKKVTLID